MCIKWHQNCNTIRKQDTLPKSLQSELSRFQKGYPLFIIIFLNPYATLCVLLNTTCADISFQREGKCAQGGFEQVSLFGLLLLQSSNIIRLNTTCAGISFQSEGKSPQGGLEQVSLFSSLLQDSNTIGLNTICANISFLLVQSGGLESITY